MRSTPTDINTDDPDDGAIDTHQVLAWIVVLAVLALWSRRALRTWRARRNA